MKSKSKSKVNSGYIGKKMSKNALKAYKDGQFPVSKITPTMLHKNSFYYSVEFFKWLCKEQYIYPKAWHHTSASYRITPFYDESVIYAVAKKYNLAVLYKIYMKKISREELVKSLGISIVSAKIIPELLGVKSNKPLIVELVQFRNAYYFTANKKIFPNKLQIQIINKFPSINLDNENVTKIINRIICLERFELI